MRYFSVHAWAGRLHQPAVADPGAWDPARVHYQDEAIVDTLLTMALVDRKVSTLEEIDAAVERSKHHPASQTLWVPETLEAQVRQRIEQARR